MLAVLSSASLSDVVVSPNARYAYVANFDSGTVSVINPATDTTTTIHTDPSEESWARVVVSPDSRYAYVTNKDGSVSVINPATGTTTTIHTDAAGGYYSGSVVVSPDSRYAYVANLDGTVSVINPATGAVTNVVPNTNYISNVVVVSPDSRYAFAVSPNTVTVINPAAGAATTIQTEGYITGALAVSPDSRYAYVINGGWVNSYWYGQVTTVIDPATGTATTIRTDADTYYLDHPVISPDGRYAYVTNKDGTVTVINPAAGTGIVINSSGAGSEPVVVTPDSRYAYIHDFAHNVLNVINPADGDVVAIPTAGSTFNRVVVSPDSHYAYVTSDDGTVTVVDSTKAFRIWNADDVSTDTYEDTSLTIRPIFIPYYTDPDTHATITGVSTPSHGTTGFDGSSITYTPNADYVGTDEFTYTASDGTITKTGSIRVDVQRVGPTPLPAAPPGYTYIQGPTTVHDLFLRLWATTNQHDTRLVDYTSSTSLTDKGMHIEQVIDPDNGDVRYVVYFGGTDFTKKLTGERNTLFFAKEPYIDPEWLSDIETMVGNSGAPIMLVGFSQGGMDAQNIGGALYLDGYKVSNVITLASPVIVPPDTPYTTLNFTPQGDSVGDGPVDSPQKDETHEYQKWVGFQGFLLQHGNLETYLTLADKFDRETVNYSTPQSTVWSNTKQSIVNFAGQILVGDDRIVRVNDGTPGGTPVATYAEVSTFGSGA